MSSHSQKVDSNYNIYSYLCVSELKQRPMAENRLGSLAKQTAIYGLSSIVGRFLNYLLVPIHTHRMAAESGGYGIVTNLYAYTALFLVLLTFGMETTFFRFSNKEKVNPDKAFSTA